MNTLAERLQFLIKNSPVKITKADMARACSIKPSSIQDWFNGRTKNLEGSNLLKTADLFKCSPIWLAEGKGKPFAWTIEKRFSTDDLGNNEIKKSIPPNSYLVEKNISEVPVYGKGMGGLPDRLFTDEGRLSNGHDEYGEVYSSDANAFITRVEGNSMIPKYHHGGYALVEPGTDPELEDDVLIKLTTGQVMLKKLVSRRGGVVLASYGDQVIYTFTPDQIVWMYYVAYPVPTRKIRNRI